MNFDSRKQLWENLKKLMDRDWGGENLNRLARECGMSPSTSTRLKMQQTSVGLETLDKLAVCFHVCPHQLIDPLFSIMSIQEPELSPLALDLGRQLDAIADPARQDKVFALASAVLQLGTLSTDPQQHGQPTSDLDAPPAPGIAQSPTPAPLTRK